MWKENIREASFRNVPFGVTQGEKEAGRRSVLHEFPLRDFPFAEDMGSAPKKFTLTAFVVGADYFEKRDALEKALNEKGAGTLVHPWYGELEVEQYAPYKVTHTAADGGMCVFTLSFVQSNQANSPSPVINVSVEGAEKANTAGLLAVNNFDTVFKIVGETAYVIEETIKAVTETVKLVQSALGGDISAIASTLSRLKGYNFIPTFLTGQNLWNTFASLGKGSGKKGIEIAMLWLDIATAYVSVPKAINSGTIRTKIAENTLAVKEFTRQIALVEASKELIQAKPASRKEAQIIRDNYVEISDNILSGEEESKADILSPKPLPDSLFTAFIDMRGITLQNLANNARTSPELVSYIPLLSLPSLVIAYNISTDIGLEKDLVERNAVIHPAFIPIKPLEVIRSVEK